VEAGMAKASGSSFVADTSVAVGVVLLSSVSAIAQQIDEAALTKCLILNSAEEHRTALKRMIVAAINDDPEALKTASHRYGMAVLYTAMAKCGVREAQLLEPAFKGAVGTYGQKLGEQIVSDAFAKIGQ
jgi:hypothetical protein